ncbi:unnamed protein product, partial [Amoebophrya sp. A25]
ERGAALGRKAHHRHKYHSDKHHALRLLSTAGGEDAVRRNPLLENTDDTGGREITPQSASDRGETWGSPKAARSPGINAAAFDAFEFGGSGPAGSGLARPPANIDVDLQSFASSQ